MMPVMRQNKCCANCIYWTGERKPDAFFGRMEIVYEDNPRGICENMKAFYHQSMNWQQSCPCFERHPIVKP